MINKNLNTWEKITLGSVAKIQGGYAFSSNDFVDDGVPVVRMSDLKDGDLDVNCAMRVSPKTAESLSEFNLKCGDFLIGMSGSLSNYAIVRNGDLPAYLNQRVGRLQLNNKSLCDYSFLVLHFLSPSYLKHVEMMAAGAAQKNISGKQIESFEIELPSLAEQQKIGSIVGIIDKLIKNTHSLIAKYNAIKQGMMQDLFFRGIDSAGKLRASHNEAPQQYKTSPLGPIPLGWEVKKVGEICDFIVPGRNKPTKFGGNIPWITTPDLVAPQTFLSKQGFAISQAEAHRIGTRIVPKDSVIMTCVGEFGITSIAGTDITINQQLHAFLCSSGISPNFLRLFLSQQRQQMINMAGQTTIPYLNKEKCNSILCVVPLIDEQEKISNRICKIENQVEIENDYLQKTKLIKQGLMQDLLTGKVRVNIDESTESERDVGVHQS